MSILKISKLTSYLAALAIGLVPIIAKAQTLRIQIPPCHMLPLFNTPGETECYDDINRDGSFSYEGGDRAFDLKSWREYQLRMTN